MKTCDGEACSPHLPFNVEFKVVYAPLHLLERDRVPGRGVRVAQEVMDSGMVGMPVRRSQRTG